MTMYWMSRESNDPSEERDHSWISKEYTTKSFELDKQPMYFQSLFAEELSEGSDAHGEGIVHSSFCSPDSFDSDFVLEYCNNTCVHPCNIGEDSVHQIDGKRDGGTKRIQISSNNFYLSTSTEVPPEALQRKTYSVHFTAKKYLEVRQFLKCSRDTALDLNEGSTFEAEICALSDSQPLIQHDGCGQISIQETSADIADYAYKDVAQHQLYTSHLYSKQSCQPQNEEYYVGPLQYWSSLASSLKLSDHLQSFFSAWKHCFHSCYFQEDVNENAIPTDYLPRNPQDYELQTSCTSEMCDSPNDELSNHSGIVRQGNLQVTNDNTSRSSSFDAVPTDYLPRNPQDYELQTSCTSEMSDSPNDELSNHSGIVRQGNLLVTNGNTSRSSSFVAIPTVYLPSNPQDYELQTSCTPEVSDYPNDELSSHSGIVRQGRLQVTHDNTSQSSSFAVGQLTYHRRYLSFIPLLLLSTITLSCASESGFSEVPTSQVVFIGEETVFRCHHSTADVIAWRVNGSSVGRNPPTDITPSTNRDDDDNLVYTLTIIARPEYNGTVVECVAVFLDGSSTEVSPTALLLVSLNSSSATTGFTETPTNLAVAEGVAAVFHCQHPTADAIGWRLNGTTLLGSTLDGVVAASTSTAGGILNTLTISALSHYNQTRVECVAYFDDSPIMDSDVVNLTIQGQLAAVDDLSRTSTTITWDPPFSLDLTDIDPDIVYCVEVYNITCGRRDLFISDCNVTEPSYTSDALYEGLLYHITVTPRSNVSNALSGNSLSITEHFVKLKALQEHYFAQKDRNLSVDIDFMKDQLDKVQASSYSLLLHSVDGVNDSNLMSPFPASVVSQQDSNKVVLNVVLPWRRIWEYEVLPYECYSDISGVAELSTHDIQNVAVLSIPGEVRVTGDFISGSEATGVLIIIYSTSDDNARFYQTAQRTDDDHLEAVVSDFLPGNQYNLSVFVLEQSGEPFSRAATAPLSVAVPMGIKLDVNQQIELNFLPNSTGVNIICKFHENSPYTSCVVISHRRISLLMSDGLTSIQSYTFYRARDGNTAVGFIDGVNLSDYQFGVIGQTTENTEASSASSVCTGCIFGSVLAVVFFILSILVLIPIVLISYKKIKNFKDARPFIDWSDETSAHNMEEGSDGCTKENFYEDIPPSKSRTVDHTPGETVPLITRTESDGPAESGESQLGSDYAHASPISPPTSSPPVTPQAVAVEETWTSSEATQKVYSELSHLSNPVIPAPPVGDEPQYDTVNKFLNPQGLVYECAKVKPAPNASQQVIPDDNHKTAFVYSKIIHPPQNQEETAAPVLNSDKSESHSHICVPPPCAPYTVEKLLHLLHSIASKWYSLGEALQLDEDHLDDINTNNETDEACLQDMLEFYMENSDFQHNWKEMADALRKIDEETIAEKIQDLHVRPYANSLPGQTEELHTVTEKSPTCNSTTLDDPSELPAHERNDNNSSSEGYHSGNTPPSDSDGPVSSSSNTSDNEDEDEAAKTTMENTVAIQPTARDIPEREGIVHVDKAGISFQPKNPKESITVRHLREENPVEQRNVHSQCEEDVNVDTPKTLHCHPNNEVHVPKVEEPVVAPLDHYVACGLNQDISGRKLFSASFLTHFNLHNEFKGFTYEYDDNYSEDPPKSTQHEDVAGDEKESSYIVHIASSTLQLANYDEHKLRRVVGKVNSSDCLWQIRAQTLSQEDKQGSEMHPCENSCSAEQEYHPKPMSIMSKSLQVDKRRVNFERLQEKAR